MLEYPVGLSDRECLRLYGILERDCPISVGEFFGRPPPPPTRQLDRGIGGTSWEQSRSGAMGEAAARSEVARRAGNMIYSATFQFRRLLKSNSLMSQVT